MVLVREGEEERLEPRAHYVLSPSPLLETAEVRAPLVFVGYGVTSPELDYDDYAGVDADGKIVVMLTGAPSWIEPNARAYLSDGALKAKNAVGHGAVGTIVIWTPQSEGMFPWLALYRFSGRGSMTWVDAAGVPKTSAPQLRGGGVVNMRTAGLLFAGAPKTLEDALANAAEGKPGSFELRGELSLRTSSRWVGLSSPNVVALLPGSDPVLKDEYVVFTAHVDHEGIGEPQAGDSIYNGAVDNASGTAALIEVARAFSTLPTAPRRSVLFVGTVAEEEGLLGAEYFADYPTVPIDAIVANVNLDGNLMLYPIADIIPFGSQHSTLDEIVRDAAADLDLGISPDPAPEQAFFIRSDQYPFVKKGIPAVFFSAGLNSSDPKLSGAMIAQEWMATTYHTPFDDLSQEMVYEAGVRYAGVAFLTGSRLANQDTRPQWKEGDFFGDKFGRKKTP